MWPCADLDIKAALTPTGAAVLTRERFEDSPRSQNETSVLRTEHQVLFSSDVAVQGFVVGRSAYFWAMNIVTGAAAAGVEIAVESFTFNTRGNPVRSAAAHVSHLCVMQSRRGSSVRSATMSQGALGWCVICPLTGPLASEHACRLQRCQAGSVQCRHTHSQSWQRRLSCRYRLRRRRSCRHRHSWSRRW